LSRAKDDARGGDWAMWAAVLYGCRVRMTSSGVLSLPKSRRVTPKACRHHVGAPLGRRGASALARRPSALIPRLHKNKRRGPKPAPFAIS